MIYFDPYKIGEIAIIKPYDIFTKPKIPIEWNINPYEYGEKYVPDQTFIFEKPLTLYAQYEDITVVYHIIWNNGNGHYEVYNPGFTTRLGSIIELADFDIVGFQTWYTKSGQSLSIGQKYQVMDDTDFYMSACNTYKLAYDPNGGFGIMDPQYAIERLWFDSSTGLSIVNNANVKLNECEFRKNNLSCVAWNVNGIQQEIGSSITLYSDLTAYAVWGELIHYSLNCNLFLVNQTLKFRYIMLKINSTLGDENRVSLSKISFNSNDRQDFSFPDDSLAYGIEISNIDSYFPLINSIHGNDTSFTATSFPCYVVFDMLTSCFDVSKYTFWKICFPTFFSLSYTPNQFALYFSNDKINWYFADECTKISSGKPGSLIYNGQIVVEDLASNIYR